jgi:hypothetical protein
MCYGIYAANKFRIHVLLPSVLVQGMRQAAIAPQVLVESQMAVANDRRYGLSVE